MKYRPREWSPLIGNWSVTAWHASATRAIFQQVIPALNYAPIESLFTDDFWDTEKPATRRRWNR